MFAAAFVLHVIVWRVRLPKRRTQWLLLLFLSMVPAAVAVNWLLPPDSWLKLQEAWRVWHVLSLHVLISLAYAEFYTAVDNQSPSATILLFVAQSGEDGRADSELYSLIDAEFVLGRRLNSMVESGVVGYSGGVYRLTDSGQRWANVFAWLRGLYSLKTGG